MGVVVGLMSFGYANDNMVSLFIVSRPAPAVNHAKYVQSSKYMTRDKLLKRSMNLKSVQKKVALNHF